MGEQLLLILEECRRPNWDGFGAEPVTMETLVNAERITRLIPDDTLIPTIAGLPDGGIGFQWENSVGSLLTLSVYSESQTTYVYIDANGAEDSGTESFSHSLPLKIQELLISLFSERG
jgi:hypothetical protein